MKRRKRKKRKKKEEKKELEGDPNNCFELQVRQWEKPHSLSQHSHPYFEELKRNFAKREKERKREKEKNELK